MSDTPCHTLCRAITDALPALPDTVEVYATVALSIAHLTQGDVDSLTAAADGEDNDRVLMRPTGFFIKLSDSIPEGGKDLDCRHGTSDSLPRIIAWAKQLGFQCIEFDNAADAVDGFPVYEW